MSERAKWSVVLAGIVVFGVVGMTALDKYDERSCRENPAIVERAQQHIEVRRNPVTNLEEQVVVTDRPAVYETCDGFLPW